MENFATTNIHYDEISSQRANKIRQIILISKTIQRHMRYMAYVFE